METRDEPSTTLYLQKKQLKQNAFSGKDPAKGVFGIMHCTSRLLVSIFVYQVPNSTNMPAAQQKKRAKNNNLSHTAQIREALLYVILTHLIR